MFPFEGCGYSDLRVGYKSTNINLKINKTTKKMNCHIFKKPASYSVNPFC
jgi:hypothetical protein